MNIRDKATRIISLAMAFLLVCLFGVPEIGSFAKDSFVSGYIQTIYNQKNGIGSNEVTCLYQSSSGYIWVGTDGGLYRSNGAEFQGINLWDMARTDVYSINCIIQDSEGRMWIGTDNYGLFYIESGENYHLENEYYSGVKSIYDVCETEDGTIFVAAENGLYTCDKNENGEMVLTKAKDESISDKVFVDIEKRGKSIWAIDGSNTIYVISSDRLLNRIDTSGYLEDEPSCIANINDNIFVGTKGGVVVNYESRSKHETYSVTVEGINGIMQDTAGRIWVCADNGLGYLNGKNKFIKTNDCRIDTYLSDMIQDYEGNYWIASTRMGVLLLSKSKFNDYNMYTGMQETMVNAVYTYGNNQYIGTDDGLIIYNNKKERVNNELTDMLTGISVRHIMVDSYGTMWISTYRRYGIVKVSKNGNIDYYTRSANLPSSIVNNSLELSDGRIAVATYEGIAIMNRKGDVQISLTDSDGLEYSNITCMYQNEKGKLFAGTDGGGIYVIDIDNGRVINNYTTENGLNSNVVTSIREGEQGLWIGTDNGLCFYNEAFRSISNVEVSNSIYDILIFGDKVWVIGSMGVLYSSEEDLLGSQGLSERYLDVNDGLLKDVNTLGKSYIDGKGILYVCCNTGICTLDTNNISYNMVAPKIKVTAVDVDGVTYEFDDLVDGLKISSDVTRIAIDFAVFSYSNRQNMQVEYSLIGFDEEPIVISGNDLMQAVYTNLEGGEYKFEITAQNGDGTECESTVSFIIEKELSIFENRIARIIFLIVVVIGLILIVIGVFRLKKLLAEKNSDLEKMSREHADAIKSSSAKNDYLANMSNEIKIPINAIMVKADEIIKDMAPSDANREKVVSIFNTGNDILEKVDDIILLAKIEAGRVEVVSAPYSIATIIYELSEEAVAKIGDKPVKFFVEIGENVTDSVIGDSEKVKDIVSRMVDNATKYTKEGSITLSVDCFELADKVHHDMANVVFTVSDTGIGIQEDKIDTIFEVYNIADNMKNGLRAGNGVGLAIAKGYADLLDGEVEVESAYGAGSTFSLSINQKITDKVTNGRTISKIEGTVSKEAADKLWLPEVNALVVDDDDVSREVSVKTLSQFDMKVDYAESGVAAIDMVMNHSYDVVFMDLSMPIMNGIDAMKEIRDLEGDFYSLLPIISMDTDAIEENKDKLIEAGFTDSLLKPIDSRRVAAILKDCLSGDKIKERPNEAEPYVVSSRYSDGLAKLNQYLEVEAAIDKIGGSIDVYNKLVVAYYNQHSASIEELFEKYGKDARGFKTKIHAIRTACINIGAYNLSKEASKIEAAINIGNRDYVKDNIEEFSEHLLEILLAIAEYMDYMESVAGMTDEEYAKKKEEEMTKEELTQTEDDKDTSSVSIELLENIKYAALDNDFDTVEKNLHRLLSVEYTGEDREFVLVLRDMIMEKNIEGIDELVTTYMDLKV